MRLNTFILGALSEAPLTVDSLITLSKKIKISKWIDFSEEVLCSRISLLKNTNLLKQSTNDISATTNQFFIPTEMGQNYYKSQIITYLTEKNINIGMLILSLTFSDHFDSKEFDTLVKKRIEALEASVNVTKNLIQMEYLSKVYNLCLSSSTLLINDELSILKLFLSYKKNSITMEPLLDIINKS